MIKPLYTLLDITVFNKCDKIFFWQIIADKSIFAIVFESCHITVSILIPTERADCIVVESGSARLQHPLSPAVRFWNLSPLDPKELLPPPASAEISKETKDKEPAKK